MNRIEVFAGEQLGKYPINISRGHFKCVLQGISARGEQVYVPFDEAMLSRHVLLLGGIGTGKTNALFQMICQIKANLKSDDIVVIFDTKGDFYKEFYTNEDIVISNDNTATDYWNIFKEIQDEEKQEEIILEISRAFFEEKIKNTNQPFFPNAAKDIFGAVLLSFFRSGEKEKWNNKALADFLHSATGKDLRELLDQYPDLKGMKSYIFDDRSPQTQGVLAELQQFARELFIGNFRKEGNLGIQELIEKKGGKIIYIEYDLGIGSILTPIYSLLFDLAIKKALSRNESEVRGNVYFVADEFRLLPNLKHIADAVNFGRSLGVKFMIGIQNVEQIYEVYGEENARSIMSGFLTNISFRVNDAKSREYIQGLYGKNRKKEIFVSAVQGKGVTEQITDGNVVEDWDISKLRIGEAVIGLPGMSPFTFQFQEY